MAKSTLRRQFSVLSLLAFTSKNIRRRLLAPKYYLTTKRFCELFSLGCMRGRGWAEAEEVGSFGLKEVRLVESSCLYNNKKKTKNKRVMSPSMSMYKKTNAFLPLSMIFENQLRLRNV